ncbi:MAG: acyl-CoA dehydrogenase, partial [Pseudomonadota bacterium]
LESIVLAGGVFARLAGAALREEMLPSIIAGDRRLALAWAEAGSRYRHDAPGVELKDGRLKGRKTFVPAGGCAGVYIVTAAHNGNFAAALVGADADGLHARPYRLADGGVACELELNDVPAKHLDGADDALAAFEDALTPVRVAATAEMVGLAALLHRTTVDYAKQREQFGRPIGSFQALQHRMVDGYRDLEQARSQLYRASLTGTADAAIGAKAFVSEAATRIGHSAVQIHGGMGMTDELAVGHALKRIMVLARLFGDAPMERARLREAA